MAATFFLIWCPFAILGMSIVHRGVSAAPGLILLFIVELLVFGG